MSLTLGIDFASFIYRKLNPIPENDETKNLSVSVIIPAHNEEKNIDAVVDAIYAQTLKPKNVMIVNDNSSDNTHERCLDIYSKHNNLFYIKNLINAGKAMSINHLVKKYYGALGDIVYINDGDLLPDPKCLEELVKGFYDENVAAVTGFPTLIASGSFLSRQLTYGKEWQIRVMSFRKVGQAARNGMYVMCGAVTGYKKDVLLKYPIPTRTQTEDLDYTWVLLEKGYKLGFQEKATCVSYDVRGLKNHWKQTRRWHRGAWQAIYSHAGQFSNAKSLLYTTLIPFWTEAVLFTAKTAALPMIYNYSPYLVGGLLAAEVTVNIGITLAREPKYLKYMPAAMLYTGVCLVSYLISGIQTTYEKLTHQEEKWNNRWNKNVRK
ncbi:MAG: glycosyltransferase family 2 protein [Candidatus Woesearchaeota archaeon]|nr:glycosyltransferase family 2 protein [Candidatus Woesearchaeota archaeon]